LKTPSLSMTNYTISKYLLTSQLAIFLAFSTASTTVVDENN